MPKCANPLFLRWVKQFHDEKDYRKRGGPSRATGYENAIRALETCTEAYAHPVDMRGKVSGVGPTTIERLTEKLEKYCESRGTSMPEPAPKPARRRKAPAAKTKSQAYPEIIIEKVERGDDLDDESENEQKPAAAKRKRAAPRKATTKRAKVTSDEDEDDEDDEDVEEEEYAPPPPKKRTRRVSARKTTTTRAKATQVDSDD